MDLVHLEHTEGLENREGWFSFHGKHKLYVPSGNVSLHVLLKEDIIQVFVSSTDGF